MLHPADQGGHCGCWPRPAEGTVQRWAVEGVGNTRAIVLFASETPPRRVLLDGAALESWQYLPDEQLLYVRYPNEPHPRVLAFEY